MGSSPITLLRALKGAPLSCVVAMKIADQPVSTQWLGDVTGYAQQAIRAALRTLNEMQLAQRLQRVGGWVLTTLGLQLTLPFPSDDSSLASDEIHHSLPANKNREEEEENDPADLLLIPIKDWYQNEIGAWTVAIRSEIARHFAHYPDLKKWQAAFEAAALHDKRSLAYVLACVRNYDTAKQQLLRAVAQGRKA